MANPQHLEILKKGVTAWNRWRDENPNVVPDLKETDLSGKADLRSINLCEALGGIENLHNTGMGSGP